MTPTERYAVDMSTGGHPADMTRNLIVARGTGWDPEALAIILAKRAAWLDYQSMVQRHWQAMTRRQDRANHYDTVATRERYVRCYGDGQTIPAFYIRPYIAAPHQDRQGRRRWAE